MAGELARFMTRNQVRASDEEREEAVHSLREHYSAGRLTSSELEERVGLAYAAITRGDLGALLTDLPSARTGRAAKRVQEANRAAWRAHATSYLAVNGGLVGIWGATGGGEFWPGWSIAPWGAFVAWHWLAARAVARRLGRRGGPGEVRGRTSRPLPR
jgi:hypothetical protein